MNEKILLENLSKKDLLLILEEILNLDNECDQKELLHLVFNYNVQALKAKLITLREIYGATPLSSQELNDKAYNAFEDESQQAKDFLEVNIDEIVKHLLDMKTTEEEFTDYFQQECERYSEYIECE